MGLTRYEQETIVNYNNGDKLASVYTADPIVIRRLDKLVKKYPEDYIQTELSYGIFYSVYEQ